MGRSSSWAQERILSWPRSCLPVYVFSFAAWPRLIAAEHRHEAVLGSYQEYLQVQVQPDGG